MAYLAISSTCSIRSAIHLITGTAMELPSALYLGPSGGCSLPLYGMSVCPSWKPCRRSHSA